MLCTPSLSVHQYPKRYTREHQAPQLWVRGTYEGRPGSLEAIHSGELHSRIRFRARVDNRARLAYRDPGDIISRAYCGRCSLPPGAVPTLRTSQQVYDLVVRNSYGAHRGVNIIYAAWSAHLVTLWILADASQLPGSRPELPDPLVCAYGAEGLY